MNWKDKREAEYMKEQIKMNKSEIKFESVERRQNERHRKSMLVNNPELKGCPV
jgi:hypothetical protein